MPKNEQKDKQEQAEESLSKQIEVIRSERQAGEHSSDYSGGLDTLDPEIDEYVLSFFKEVTSTLKIGKISLATPEKAKMAAKELKLLQEKIDTQKKTAQALKKMLQTYQLGPLN